MKISEVDAAEHIVNSLDNTGATDWYDDENDVNWSVSVGGLGIITISITDEDDNEEEHSFTLVALD